jgi:hypothetical protein
MRCVARGEIARTWGLEREPESGGRQKSGNELIIIPMLQILIHGGYTTHSRQSYLVGYSGSCLVIPQWGVLMPIIETL